MIECRTLQEAQAVENVVRIHREADNRWLAYQQGDQLPVQPQPTPDDLKQAARRAAKQYLNDPEAVAILMRARDIANFKLFRTLMPTLTKAAYVKMITDEIDAGNADA